MVSPYYQKTVGTTALRLVEPNRKRTSLIIFNQSTGATLYVGFDNHVSTVRGMPVAPQTGMVFSELLGDRPDLEYWVLSSAVSTDLRIMEAYARQEGE